MSLTHVVAENLYLIERGRLQKMMRFGPGFANPGKLPGSSQHRLELRISYPVHCIILYLGSNNHIHQQGPVSWKSQPGSSRSWVGAKQ